MKIRTALLSLFALAPFCAVSGLPLHAATKTLDLRCEYVVNPMGLDEPRPQLSWRMESDQGGEIQTAYRILVASSEEKLAQD